MEDELTELPDRDYDVQEILETYRRDGTTLREKARVILEEAYLPAAYKRLTDPDLPASAMNDTAKVLVDIGDVKPKSNQPTTSGPGFSIQIVLPSPDGEKHITLTATPVDQDDAPCSSDTDETQAALPAPEEVNFNTPAMDFNFELGSGVPPDQYGDSDEA